VDAVRALIRQAENDVAAAIEAHDASPAAARRVHRAQQVLLLVRLAADTGARRGELACLQFGDLDGDVLTIARAASCEVVGPTKTGRIRRLTLGVTTAGLWRSSMTTWPTVNRRTDEPTTGSASVAASPFGPWLFSRRPDHATRLTTSCAGHWFADLAHRAGHPDVTLHRLRHTVATVLVGQGDILQAQHRLGHRDASTTLRIYSHALPLTDADAAARLDELYR
jgi:integrase